MTRSTWHNPLPLTLVPTSDTLSWQHMPHNTTGLPLLPHPGAFAAQRKHHQHEGVDLYCEPNTPVYAVELGTVLYTGPFTGPAMGHHWWLPTEAAWIKHPSGVVVYGEIATHLKAGQLVQRGDLVGTVQQVIKNPKARPTSMLHLELRSSGIDLIDWCLDSPQPQTLLDPTPYLLKCLQPSKP